MTVPGAPFGALDVASPLADDRLRVAGWAIEPERVGPIDVHVYVRTRDGRVVGFNLGAADRTRGDVGRAFPAYGDGHGFDAELDVPGGAVGTCAYGIGVGAGGNALIGCRAL